jgi:hypothetical protein
VNPITEEITHITNDFKPILADDIEITFFKEDERGTFYLARNPRDQRYIKLHQAGVDLVQKFDGETSISHLQKDAEIPVKDFVLVLAKAGFLKGIKTIKKEEPFYTVKIPFFRTDSEPLKKLYKSMYWMGSTPFKLFYAVFVGGGFLLFLINFDEIFSSTLLNFDLTMPLTPLLIIMAMFYIVEFAHEFAHTGTSYYYGAEPGNVGIVFHFLVGFFYVETPDTRKLSDKGNMMVFLAGPLTSLFAAEVCTYIFLFTDSMPLVWGGAAFFWHISTLITLCPFMQTDGYYILQHKLKFPNLFTHAIKCIRLNIFRLFGVITKEEYNKKMGIHTQRERIILKGFSALLLIQIGVLIYIFFFMAVKVNMFKVIQLAPVILFTDHLYGIKGYFLLGSYCLSLTFATVAATLTTYRFFKRGEEAW